MGLLRKLLSRKINTTKANIDSEYAMVFSSLEGETVLTDLITKYLKPRTSLEISSMEAGIILGQQEVVKYILSRLKEI